MKTRTKVATFLLLISAFISQTAFSNDLAKLARACDEACIKSKAEREHGVKFPSYLTFKFCETTRDTFLESDNRSITNYREKDMDPKYTGGINNMRKFISQRREWLAECDDYTRKTERGRLFSDNKTTDSIFKAMDSVTKELQAILDGVTYSTELGSDSLLIAGEKFDHLIKVVDDHKSVLQLKGQYVAN
ncbi:hypothetical protein [Marinibactrum halimedae]|uniref:DUF1311 domain-containing protein n=1 Tax=Marinibactrum halimedae TaxID=1444977 RepID=A0AA37WNA7_9GAMM|nr:hypothetical protein [Marinibactrum halimedae]MCD9458648.1 hypothetical protein [Marinibactrum halimedae]GLS25986.1 hypothetical protein GCM10007877_17010 [Marinibactrum halimedae]